MAVVSKTTLKSYFEDGKEPDENKYIDLIDTMSIVDGVTDHGALSGKGDDDHTQYVLASGARAITGDFAIGGGLYIGSTSPVTTDGRLKITENFYAGGGIVLGYVSGTADADGIRMFTGTTLRGDIETQNSAWLRLNTHAASNTYTPKSFAAAGTLSAGTSAFNSTGDVSYTGNLRPLRSSYRTGYVYVPISYNNGVGWSGTGRSTSGPSSITVSSTFTSVPSTAKAVNLRMIARDSAGHIQTNLYFGVGATSANPYDLAVHPVGNDHQMENQGIVNLLTANTIYYRITASGSSTMDCWLVCMGYWI